MRKCWIFLLVLGFFSITTSLLAQLPNNFLFPIKKPDRSTISMSNINLMLPDMEFASITQSFLDTVRSVQTDKEIETFQVKLKFTKTDKQGQLVKKYKRPRITICYQYDGLRGYQTAYGCFIAADSTGVYLYSPEKKRLGYIDYKKIRSVRRGLSLGDKVTRDIAVGAGIGAFLLAFSAESSAEIILYAFGGAIAGVAYAAILTPLPELIMHQIQNANPDIKYVVDFKQKKWLDYIDRIEYQREHFNNPIFYEDFPMGSKTLPELTEPDFPQRTENSAVSSDSSSSNETSNNTISTSVNSQDVVKTDSQMANLPVASKSVFNKNDGVSCEWILAGFQGKKVDLSRLMKSMPNLRNDKLEESDRTKFKNNHELQFAAMWMLASVGYDFRNKEELTEEQQLEIQQWLPLYNTVIADAETVVKVSRMSVTELENLKRLYEWIK